MSKREEVVEKDCWRRFEQMQCILEIVRHIGSERTRCSSKIRHNLKKSLLQVVIEKRTFFGLDAMEEWKD